ncbi:MULTISPECIES: hypothetical protein [unclassified Streptomyces]|uniref:hypothetical protein n=1 Tax=unclassified Streptomyces TaxID=2593676 RepID=UPI002F90EE39|nr:hypothetical protein OG306_40375 [Streptomyces sp. NBC_01241]
MDWTMKNPLPAEGRTVGFVGKGGGSKSTSLIHCLRYWGVMGIPAVGHDADDSDKKADGSLKAWANMLPVTGPGLGSPVYGVPDAPSLAAEVNRLRSPHGISAIDTKAWENDPANLHYATIRTSDLLVLALYPSGMETYRGGSILGAMDTVEGMTGHRPRLVCLLTRFNPRSSSVDEVRNELEADGLPVLKAQIPASEDKRTGLAHSFGKMPRLKADSPLHQLAKELVLELAK